MRGSLDSMPPMRVRSMLDGRQTWGEPMCLCYLRKVPRHLGVSVLSSVKWEY